MRGPILSWRNIFVLSFLGAVAAMTASKWLAADPPATSPATNPAAAAEVTVDLGGGVNIKLVKINPGTFEMGSPSTEMGRDVKETQHKVTLTKGFYMATTLVTQAQWRAVEGTNPSNFRGDNLPVETVTYDDVMDFCTKLSAKDGKHYRLPTEAEWEYACRAGTTTMYNTGDGDHALDAAGWYAKNSGRTTHAVGQKQANAWGLYDMHGNVLECCSDWSGKYPAGDATDPQGPATGMQRVVRGGSWDGGRSACRSVSRWALSPGYWLNRIGFRIVLDNN